MKMYAITHVNAKLGLRQLTFGNQGRNHYKTRDEAEAALKLYAPSLGGSWPILKVLAPGEAETLEVREVDCYDHGDAKGIYFEDKITVDVNKLERLLIDWHMDDEVDEAAARKYAKRFIRRMKNEAV